MNKSIFLLFGEENFLIDLEIKNIKTKKNIDDDSIVKYDMLEENISQALDDFNTTSIFSEKKLIICNNCVFLTGSNKITIDHNIEKLLKNIEVESQNILILVVNAIKLDERKKIVKELKKRVNVLEFKILKDFELEKFIKNEIEKTNYKIDNHAIKTLVQRCDSNLGIIYNEIEKLKIYKADEKTINKEDIVNLTPKLIKDNIFELVFSIVERDIETSLKLYDDLLILNEEPIKLIVILANQFRLIYQTKTMYKSGYSEFDISKHLEVHPYRIKLANQVKISEKLLLKYLSDLADLDINIKTGKIDKNSAFEFFLLNM